MSGTGMIDDYANFQDFKNQPWTAHYAIPQYGGLGLDINLAAPLRTDEGFENADVHIDYLMGTIERSYNRDWNQQAVISDLSIPKALIESLEKLLRKWHGEQLTVRYCLLPGEGDPMVIRVEFRHCHAPSENPDRTLSYIAQHLTEALAS
jgi:hypothetical protein